MFTKHHGFWLPHPLSEHVSKTTLGCVSRRAGQELGAEVGEPARGVAAVARSLGWVVIAEWLQLFIFNVAGCVGSLVFLIGLVCGKS